MNSKALKPRQALNKAYLKVKPGRAEIETFKANLIRLLDGSNEKESEEFHKNLVSDFLKDTYYKKSYFINTKGRNDLVVHNGGDANTTVGVIIEAKKPTNKTEMVSPGKLNAKAFQELVLYYLRERILHKNLEVRHLVITNIYEWYIFDATLFDRLFAQHKGLVKQFQEFEEKRLADVKTDFFYKQIAEPFINELKGEVEYTYFDLRDYQKAVRNTDKDDDNMLISLYKLLSPEHLLKLPFANDSNSLDKKFYSELLHIIGLSETKEGSKKLIGRSKESDRHLGTLLESAINQLDAEDRIRRIEKPGQFGATLPERLYNVGLELTLTWINRILFLKLLEAQLISYHKGDKAYAFLNGEAIKSYDDLNGLFFQVLARKHQDRQADVKQAFEKVPYLNSSLFEPTDLEQNTLFISNLKDDRTIPIFGQTVLKDEGGKKRTGALNTLDYLFQFLDAYDFGSEGTEDIQEDNKPLINASVLGLIFEKINGYKDGSFFTPGFITMYMCRETIRRAVVQKFNEAKTWQCETFEELYDKIDDRKEANKIINSLHICDPAVGSGHFLVSALNEVIAIKNDLRILQDRDGKRLKEYHVEVVNDELIITDEEGELFEYKPGHKESQRVQETLFHEKQTIIENCLFGVDINPNSVKICRLRLWIELLKNAYYKNERELETLPNIDINIKCGNSLVSRFAIDADLGQALKKSKWSIDDYRIYVDTYRNAQNKEQKRDMESLIEGIKSDFRSEISKNDPKLLKLSKLKGDLFNLTNQTSLFALSDKEKTAWEKQIKKIQADIVALEKEIEEIKANKIYENAFEWRFEFPEVLNDKGDFVGFDVVIGNPPYGLFNKKQNQKISLTTDDTIIEILKKQYPEATGGVLNAARIFLAFSFKISSEVGYQAMIIPFGILTDTTSANLRKHIFEKHSVIKIDSFPERDNTSRRVFEDVKMSTSILITCSKNLSDKIDAGISYKREISTDRTIFSYSELVKLNPDLIQIPLTNSKSFDLLVKIYEKQNIFKLGSISKCLTGEIDMTFGKPAITEDPQDNIFVKGVQIDRYIFKKNNKDISQGTIEFINKIKLEKIVSNKKLEDSQEKRIALQGLTGVNERKRLKATLINKNIFLANSCNYLLSPAQIECELILGWLNSKLLNFVFKCRSTSSNVNGYEVDELPFCRSEFDNEIIHLVKSIASKKEENINFNTELYENEIDRIIYTIFNLNNEDITLIEDY